MIGVRSGTNSSRGVRAVSWKRRLARVASGPKARGRACEAGIAISAVDIGSPFDSGGRGEGVAGQPEVDVVEGGLASADRAGEPELVNGCDRVAGGGLVQRHGQPRADREGVPAGDAPLTQRGERAADVSVDVQLDQLATELGEQRRRRVERDDPAGVNDRDAVAESLRL